MSAANDMLALEFDSSVLMSFLSRLISALISGSVPGEEALEGTSYVLYVLVDISGSLVMNVGFEAFF